VTTRDRSRRFEPVVHEIVHRHRTVRALDWPGEGAPVLFLHPTALCAGIFEPLARRLTPQRRVVAVDLPGHGGSAAPPDPDALAFTASADAVVAALDELRLERTAAVGQSMGGGVAITVDRIAPGRLDPLLLVEAAAVPSEFARPGQRAEYEQAARARRHVFEDEATMVEHLARRPALDRWSVETLEAYARWGTVVTDDGTVALACTPEHEAASYVAAESPDGAAAAWEHLATPNAAVAVLVGSDDLMPGGTFAAQAARAGAPLLEAEGSHFLLQEDPERAVTLVREGLAASR